MSSDIHAEMGADTFSQDEAAAFFRFFLGTSRAPIRMINRAGRAEYVFKAGVHRFTARKGNARIHVEHAQPGREDGTSYFRTHFDQYRVPGPFTPLFEPDFNFDPRGPRHEADNEKSPPWQAD